MCTAGCGSSRARGDIGVGGAGEDIVSEGEREAAVSRDSVSLSESDDSPDDSPDDSSSISKSCTVVIAAYLQR